MKGPPLCTTCGHTTVIHDRDGKCPRWAGRLDTAGLRVVIRIGNSKLGCAGHLLAFLADTLEVREMGTRGTRAERAEKHPTQDVGVVVVWDLDADTQEEMPLFTVREPWSKASSNDQKAEAVERLRRDTGEVIKVVARLGG